MERLRLVFLVDNPETKEEVGGKSQVFIEIDDFTLKDIATKTPLLPGIGPVASHTISERLKTLIESAASKVTRICATRIATHYALKEKEYAEP